jgi:hypothetical protein
MTDLSAPSSLRRLIEESGDAFAVIEEAVGALRAQIADLEPGDADVVAILRAHLLAIGSPSDTLKFFSLELLERVAAEEAPGIYLEALDALARSPIQPERTYPVERAMIRKLGEAQAEAALPVLAVLAGREVYPLSRTAARAVATIVGSTDAQEISDRFKREDLPEVSSPDELSEGVSRALFPQKKTSAKSSQERRRNLTIRNALPAEVNTGLRPESQRARQRRLKAILRAAGRDPSRCGNCEQGERVVVGHVVPPERGGTDRAGNLTSLCGDCRRKLPRGRGERWGVVDAAPVGDAANQLDLF